MRTYFPIFFRHAFILCCLFVSIANSAFSTPVSVLVPSQPGVETAKVKKANESSADVKEVDVLISLMEAFEQQGVDMDMPQIFALFAQNGEGKNLQMDRKDLLGDVEEIRYLDKKAWGVNVAVEKPGLYQFIMETKPWWDEENQRFLQDYAKTILPVQGVEGDWHNPLGISLEIVPLTRPFGLTAPAFFSARILRDGKPCENVPVTMSYINTGKIKTPTDWHKTMEARSDSNGQFSFVLNQPGWWYCKATLENDPLKGPDGQMRPLYKSAIFWLYVDSGEKAKK